MNTQPVTPYALDESSYNTSTGLATPEQGPLVQPITIDHGVNTRLDQYLNGRSFTKTIEISPLEKPAATSHSQERNSCRVKRVCIVGAGYVGGPTAAVLALHNPNVQFEVVDRDVTRVKLWNSSHLPIYEPDLSGIIRLVRDGTSTDAQPFRNESERASSRHSPNLVFTVEVADSMSQADMILLAVETPAQPFGKGIGRATDMSAFDSVVKNVGKYARSGTIIVEKSTVPCGTARRVKSLLRSSRPESSFEVLSNPEFLAEGSAIKNLMQPDRVIIGCSNTRTGKQAAGALADLYAAWVPRERILESNVWSSELSKLAANAMLAQRVSSINSISVICEETGADVDEVADSIGQDHRIGSQFLKAGIGFGGSCFKKDVASLTYLAESLGLDEIAHYWSQVNYINGFQCQRFARRVIMRLNENLIGKKISLLGFAFKKNTGDARESAALETVRHLAEERPREIAIFDPFCREADIVREVKHLCSSLSTAEAQDLMARVKVYTDPYEACARADAVLLITDHAQFQLQTESSCWREDEQTGAEDGFRLGVALTNSKLGREGFSQRLESSGRETLCSKEMVTYHLRPQPECTVGAKDCPDCAEEEQAKFDMIPSRFLRPKLQPLDWSLLLLNMNTPRRIFDGRNTLDVKEIEKLGFEVEIEGIGKNRNFCDETH